MVRSSIVRCWVGGAALAVCAVPVGAAVNLELRPLPAQVLVGDTVDVGIYAVASGADELFTALEVVLSWDKAHLELREANANGPHAWSFQFGLLDDSDLDGLNDSLLDGNARFEAASFGDATATAGGMLVATLRFSALTGTELTHIAIAPEFGQYSRTQVLQRGGKNVTGNLGTADVTIGAASLQAVDMTMPAGRTAEAMVRGSIIGLSTFGLMVILDIVPREGALGTVTFTPTAGDVVQRGDPWPGAGMFNAFDTDSPGFSATLNGSVDDDGGFLVEPVTFTGPLTGFGIIASNDAVGVWDLMLTTTDKNGEHHSSAWTDLDTTLIHGTLRIVDLGDGDGDTAIDLRDFAEFQVCFTGEAVLSDQPAYYLAPERRCVVYDFDGDGDVDNADFRQFSDAVSGPVP